MKIVPQELLADFIRMAKWAGAELSGIQEFSLWIPVSAGMTGKGGFQFENTKIQDIGYAAEEKNLAFALSPYPYQISL
jgi:hypothetical protein